MAGGFEVPHPVSEEQIEQLMLAFRIYFPEADIFLSTRERHEFRMKMAPLCVSHISAGSKVAPGAYTESLKKKENDLGQFTVIDDHSVENVVSGLVRMPRIYGVPCCAGLFADNEPFFSENIIYER